MEKKLYRVQVVLYVLAEDESEASWVATNARFDVFDCVARRAKKLDTEWNDAIPYNSDDDRTCSEIFSRSLRITLPKVVQMASNSR